MNEEYRNRLSATWSKTTIQCSGKTRDSGARLFGCKSSATNSGTKDNLFTILKALASSVYNTKTYTQVCQVYKFDTL